MEHLGAARTFDRGRGRLGRRSMAIVVAVAVTTATALALSPAFATAVPFTVDVGCTGTAALNEQALVNAFSAAATHGGPAVIELGSGCTFEVTSAHYGGSGVGWGGPGTLTVNGNGSTITRTGSAFIGIVGNNGDLTLNGLTLSNGVNTGIGNFAGATLHVNDSTISGNTANGGIYNTGVASVNRSTISGNSAIYGGGILNDNTLTVSNSTLSGNTAAGPFGYGAAIFTGVTPNSPTTTIVNSTIAGNSALLGGGGTYTLYGATSAENTIFAGNIAGTGPGAFTHTSNCGGGVTDNHRNISYPSDPSCSGFSSSDPHLGLLADNGGPTKTMALGAGSAALDTVPASGADCAATDQRGAVRPQGSACDIGAYELDTSSPAVPSITAHPAASTIATSASFSFSDTDAGVTFRCALDAAAFSACTSPAAYAGPIAAGAHAFHVKAVESATNNISAAASFDWTIDTTAPTVSLDAVTSATNDTTPTFSGIAGNASGDSATVTVDVYAGAAPDYVADTPTEHLTTSRDGLTGAYSVDASPVLAEGTYTARAEQSDGVGNIGHSTESTFTVDTAAPPTPSFTSTPDLITSATSASFDYTDAEGGVAFSCRLDSAAFASCSSSAIYAGPIAEGSHTFDVKATDGAGNTSTAATFTWTIDATAPSVTITAPSGATGATPVFSGAAGNASGDGTTVAIDVSDSTPSVVRTATVDRTGASWTYDSSADASFAALSDGTYTATATQCDDGSNCTTSVATTFSVDTSAPPAPSITDSPATLTHVTSASFSFSDTEAGVTFQCEFDGDTLSACLSPTSYGANGGTVPEGLHTFEVVAVDGAGNVSQAASFSWTVDGTAPTVSLDLLANPTNDTTAVFSGVGGTTIGDSAIVVIDIYSGTTPDFTTDVPVEQVNAPRDGATGAYSVHATPALAEGDYTARATQSDDAGNNGYSHAWPITVDTTAPPAPTYTATPELTTKVTSASFTVSDTEGGVTFSCELDGGGFSICAPTTYTDPLSAGPHTYQVVATDAAGNTSSAASYSWTIDTTTSVAITLVTDPVTTANDTSAAASGTAEPGDSVDLTVADGTPAHNVTDSTTADSTTGAWSFTSLNLSALSGPITYSVVATDGAGNTASDSASAAKSFLVACSGTASDNEQALADAFTAANSHAGADTIELGSACTFTLTTVHDLSTANSGLGNDGPLTVNGNGSTITRDGSTSAFRLIRNSSDLTLNEVNLTNGHLADDNGAGIRNGIGSLTIVNSTLSGNSTDDGYQGGAIYNGAGTVALTDSTLSGNRSYGGGISSYSGTVTVTNSTISGNSGWFLGGGLVNQGTTTVTNSTIAGNTTDYYGAGIYNGTSGTLTVRDSTIAGNSTTYIAAGLFNDGSATVENSILANNVAAPVGGSIVVGNCGGTGSTTDLLRNVTYPADAQCPSGFFSGDPKLAALADNGGPTKTMALGAGSAAVDRVPVSGADCPATDQRGVARPLGTACDSGAYESTGFPTTVTAITSDLSAPTAVGQAYAVAGTVISSGTAATGTVAVSDGAASCTATIASHTFSCDLTSTTTGTKTITATYAGDGVVLGSFATASHDVKLAAVLTYTGVVSSTPGAKITLSATLKTSGGAALAGRVVRFTLNGTIFTTTTSAKGVASAATTAPAIAGTYPMTVAFAGDATYAPATRTLTLAARVSTALTYTGATSGIVGATVNLTATLKTSSGALLAGRTVAFTLNGSTYSVTTGTSGPTIGVATVAVTAPANAGSYAIGINFAGDAADGPSNASATLSVTVPTVVTYTGPTTAARNATITLSATLVTSGGAPIAGKTLKFTFNGRSHSVTTNALGVATVSVTAPKSPGSYPITVGFVGDTTYALSSKTVNLTVT
ncbi:MAG: putative internalin [Acidimicrobiales bacterium]|jgi:hypothetical protein|nr:putative internalin [Acidimicrobiales bacterium]